MKKLIRNTSTPESAAWWKSAEENVEKIASWPDWKRTGINEVQQRSSPRLNMGLVQQYIDLYLELEMLRSNDSELSQNIELNYAEKFDAIWDQMAKQDKEYVEEYLKKDV